MEKAKVFIAEDEDYLRNALAKRLANEGHTILYTAKDQPDALQFLSDNPEIKPDFGVLDGNMPPLLGDCAEGRAIEKALKERNP
jgi:CheY-like chemotaxis protein